MFTNKLILRKLSKKIVKMKCEGDRSDKSVRLNLAIVLSKEKIWVNCSSCTESRCGCVVNS